jgi:hypothetical protein
MTMETATLARLYTSLAYAYDMHHADKSGTDQAVATAQLGNT